MEFYEAAHDDPMSFDLNLDIAETEHEVGHPMQAIPYYEKALRIPVDSQTSAQVLARLAQAYSDIGERARAREYYQTALQMQSLPPPRRVVNWQGAWWNDLASLVLQRLHKWKTKLVGPS